MGIWCWRIYQFTTENWHQIWIWLKGSFKGFRMKIEILADIFDWTSMQQFNLLLFLSVGYCQNLGLTDLPGMSGEWRETWIWFSAHIKVLRVQIEIFYFSHFLIVGCYVQRLHITDMNLDMNLCLEYQSE